MDNNFNHVKQEIVCFFNDDDFFVLRNLTVEDDFSQIDIRRDVLELNEPLSNFDEFELYQFFTAIESQFNVEISETDIETLRSLEDLVNFIVENQ